MISELDANLRLAILVAGEISLAVPKLSNPMGAGRVSIPGPYIIREGKVTREATYPHNADNNLLLSQRKKIEKASRWSELFDLADKLCRKSGIGNCGELAAMACKSLRTKGALYVDYISVTDCVTTGSPVIPHSIAVIGRSGREIIPDVIGAPQYFFNLDIGLPDTWNSSAVICDPWARAAYPARDYDKFWGRLKSFTQFPKSLTCHLLYRFRN